jgi:hypothetical protein
LLSRIKGCASHYSVISQSTDMNQMMTRRRFAQLAIASSTVATFGSFAKKSFAQTTVTTLYGITTQGASLLVQSLDLGTGKITDVSSKFASGVTLDPGDRITGFTSLSDNTLVVCITPSRSTSKKKKDNYPPYLIYLGSSPTTQNLSGIKNGKETVLDLLGTKDGFLYGLVTQYNGRPPTRIVTIDVKTGKIVDRNSLGNQQSRILAEAADSTIYTANVDSGGIVTIGNAKLTSSILTLDNGIRSLVGDPSNKSKFYALVSQKYDITSSVFSIDFSGNQDPKVLATGWEVIRMTRLLSL